MEERADLSRCALVMVVAVATASRQRAPAVGAAIVIELSNHHNTQPLTLRGAGTWIIATPWRQRTVARGCMLHAIGKPLASSIVLLSTHVLSHAASSASSLGAGPPTQPGEL